MLAAASSGPFFDHDEEFSTIFGLHRFEVAEIANNWSMQIKDPETTVTAVNNSFNNLLGYPHGMDDQRSGWISMSQGELQTVFQEWKRSLQSQED
ncbi:hypothetical protein [Leptospira koniambonensis]|uniref:hypothetical protein n=1 Tax=Leptospira koniambonensis TaxID=2484950 RepID=UPI003EBAE1FF